MDNDEEISAIDALKDGDKWRVAFIIGVIFLIMTSPVIFSFSNGILSYIGLSTADKKGRPTMFGWILHALIFVIIVRVLMR